MDGAGQYVALFGAILAIVGVVAAAVPVWRAKSSTATIELLESSLAVRDKALAELRADCARDAARLEGRIEVLTGSFARELGAAIAGDVAGAVVDVVVRELGRSGVIERRSSPRDGATS